MTINFTRLRRLGAACLALVMLFSMSACSSFADDVTALVQGNLDELYLGVFSDDYIKLVDSTEEECREAYESGLEVSADTFAYYFDIEYVDDELKADIVELYKDIYSHSKYTVNPATKMDDKTYAIKVLIEPIDIFQLVDDNWDEGMAAFYDKYAEADISTMTEEEYTEFDRDWAESIIAICREQLPNVGYMEEQSLAVQVVKDSNDVWTIADSDLAGIDAAILYYPG